MIDAKAQESLPEKVFKISFPSLKIEDMSRHDFVEDEYFIIKKICEIAPIHFEWAIKDLYLISSISGSAYCYFANLESSKFSNEYFKSITDFIDFSRDVLTFKNKIINMMDNSYCNTEYYLALKKYEEFEAEVKLRADRFKWSLHQSKTAKLEPSEIEDCLSKEERLIYWIARSFEIYSAEIKGIEDDLVNFPFCRKGIATKQLSSDDIFTYVYNDGQLVKEYSAERGKNDPARKLQFFTGDFFFLVWGVYTALNIPKRKQARKVEGDDFFNLAADSEAFAKTIIRALDKVKTSHFRLLELRQNTN